MSCKVPPSPPDSYGQEPEVPSYTTVITITQVRPTENWRSTERVHGPYRRHLVHPPVQEFGNPSQVPYPLSLASPPFWETLGSSVSRDHNLDRHYPTNRNRGLDVHPAHPPTVVTTILVQLTRARVCGPPY